MTLEEDRNARCPPEQNFPNVVLSGSPSMISTYSSLQLRLLEQREGQASALGIVVPLAGSLSCLDPTQSHCFVHQTSQAGAHGEGDSSFSSGWWSPRTLAPTGAAGDSLPPGQPHWWGSGKPTQDSGIRSHGRAQYSQPWGPFPWATSTESGESQTGVCDATPASPSAPLAQGAQHPLLASRIYRGERGVQLSLLWAKCTQGCHTPAEVSVSSSCP